MDITSQPDSRHPVLASSQAVQALEHDMRQEFQSQLEKIPDMDLGQLDILIRRLAHFDEIRGLLPAQEPAQVYKHSPEFSLWEDGLLRTVVRRQAELGR